MTHSRRPFGGDAGRRPAVPRWSAVSRLWQNQGGPVAVKMLLRRAPNRADDAQARERRPLASSPGGGRHSGPQGRGGASPNRRDGRALTLAKPGVIGAGFALPRVPTGGRRSRAAGAIWTVGAPARGCIFTATGPPGFHHRLLSEVGLGRAHYCAGHQCSAAKPVVLLAQRGEQTGYRRPLPRRPRSGGRSSSPRMSS